MRIWTNAIVAGGMIAAAVVVKALVRSRRGASATPTDERTFSPPLDAGTLAVAELEKELHVIAAETQPRRLPR